MVHNIILDAGPLLNNNPSISTLLAISEKLFTVPSVIAEVRDKNARIRLETTILPFLIIRTPVTTSVKFITDFARKTGDLAVLSKPDIQILALAYELECERNQSDWRLRRSPAQRGLNGSPPAKQDDAMPEAGSTDSNQEEVITSTTHMDGSHPPAKPDVRSEKLVHRTEPLEQPDALRRLEDVSTEVAAPNVDNQVLITQEYVRVQEMESSLGGSLVSDSEVLDSEGWINPSNLQKHQANDQDGANIPLTETTFMQVATITTDFAMQNILLQINLNLLSPSLQRVQHLKTYVLRCHACFEKTKDMGKHFCPRCGKPTLTRVACSTSKNGGFKMHLKKNIQWNTRGDRFSIPKPVGGTANGRLGGGKGGGKGGWGQELILAEDQKEYLQAMKGQNRRKERSLMDEDYLPGILTGERGRADGRPKIGGGRNVNSKKR